MQAGIPRTDRHRAHQPPVGRQDLQGHRLRGRQFIGNRRRGVEGVGMVPVQGDHPGNRFADAGNPPAHLAVDESRGEGVVGGSVVVGPHGPDLVRSAPGDAAPVHRLGTGDEELRAHRPVGAVPEEEGAAGNGAEMLETLIDELKEDVMWFRGGS